MYPALLVSVELFTTKYFRCSTAGARPLPLGFVRPHNKRVVRFTTMSSVAAQGQPSTGVVLPLIRKIPPGKPLSRVVFLTGATGFLGGWLVKELQDDPSIAKVYCPIRAKKGLSGAERMVKSLGLYDKCVHLDIDASVPADTTHVIFNAYSTRFDETLQFKLEQNVVPILKTLDECRLLKGSLQGIAIVSTAYVQPPVPFPRPAFQGRIPFAFGEYPNVTAWQLYEQVLSRGDSVIPELLPGLDQFYHVNRYAFSKHILEHLLIEKYADMPIAVVRPSMICPSADLTYGYEQKSGISLIFSLAPHFVFLTPRGEGKVNLVALEYVTSDTMDAVFKLASPAVKDENGHLWHPIIMSTSHSNASPFMLLRGIAPYIPRMDIRVAWLRNCFRQTEFLLARLAYGPKAAMLLGVLYDNYDYIAANTWDFEPKYPEDFWKLAVEGGRLYLKMKNETEAKKIGISHSSFFWFVMVSALVLFSAYFSQIAWTVIA
jgi:nucleoside-diphosphate-sugar epimerase